jgi:hypothetical protein
MLWEEDAKSKVSIQKVHRSNPVKCRREKGEEWAGKEREMEVRLSNKLNLSLPSGSTGIKPAGGVVLHWANALYTCCTQLSVWSCQEAGALSLEPHLQSTLLWLFWRWGSLLNYFPGLGLNHDPCVFSLLSG